MTRLLTYSPIAVAAAFGTMLTAMQVGPLPGPDERQAAFHRQVNDYHFDINVRIPDIVNRTTTLHRKVNAMHRIYDRIIIQGPDGMRDGWVENYDHERMVLVADIANLQTLVRGLESTLQKANKLLGDNPDLRQLSSWADLSVAVKKGKEATYEARNVVRPASLPDELPDAPLAAVHMSDPRYANPEVIPEVPNELIVAFTSRLRYTNAVATVEARVREGNARLNSPAIQQIAIAPGDTKEVAWSFTCTGDGNLRIGARIVSSDLAK